MTSAPGEAPGPRTRGWRPGPVDEAGYSIIIPDIVLPVPDHRLRVVRDRLKTPGEIIVGKVAITHDENMRIIVTVSCEK